MSIWCPTYFVSCIIWIGMLTIQGMVKYTFFLFVNYCSQKRNERCDREINIGTCFTTPLFNKIMCLMCSLWNSTIELPTNHLDKIVCLPKYIHCRNVLPISRRATSTFWKTKIFHWQFIHHLKAWTSSISNLYLAKLYQLF